ncbi:MAG: PQQ-binding-like beta-propeller repeat protein, partial [Merismopedia sp. SIO2A8]|nr:PQQ-binding-like beta-propeller repeat protein [Merismopedia sp. SIO2A8]
RPADVKGPILPEPRNEIDPTKTWEGLFGPTGNGISMDDVPLVDDFKKGVYVWKSQERIPQGKYPGGDLSGLSGGFASPTVWDGDVFLYYYVPSGDVYDFLWTGKGNKPHKWLIHADDVIIRIDGQTGRTVWKKSFKEMGMNWTLERKAGPAVSNVVYDGIVYAVGTTGNVYAVDAETGETVWISDIGKRATELKNQKATALETERLVKFQLDFMGNPIVAGDVLVVHGFTRGLSPLVAFDLKTGAKRWTSAPAIAATEGTPAKWVHNGKEYVISGTQAMSRLIDPADGSTVWELRGDVPGYQFPVVHGDYLVTQKLQRADNGAVAGRKVGVYKISLEGLEEVWVNHTFPYQFPVVYNDAVYIGGDERNDLVVADLHTGKQIGILKGTENLNKDDFWSFLIADNKLFTRANDDVKDTVNFL